VHDNSTLVLDRIARYVAERVTPAVYRRSAPLTITAWEVPDEPVPFADAIGQSFESTSVGRAWGKPWGTTWFHLTGEAPSDWFDAGCSVELYIDLGYTPGQPGFQAEGLAWRPDGTIIKALEPLNAYVPIDGPGPIDVYVEAASNPDVGSNWTFQPTPVGDKATAGDAPIYVLRRMDVAQRDGEVWALEQDVWTLRGLLAVLPSDSPRAAEILRALERAVDATDPDDVAGTASAARAALAGALAAPANASAHRITAVGHAHIDSAWLWPTRETIRKCARTFSNVLRLMDEDPDFVFACSSAQQYAWIERFYPELFERIRARVAQGRFIPVGGMWVESDTNMPGGEALARQFVAGQGYFRRAFGMEPIVGWLPDSFGYTGALPQLLEHAGLTYFLTQKISWNETDTFPHHTFWWQGIDGSRVYTHFPPVDSYNAVLSGEELAKAERQYAEKGLANSSLVPFGFGDGGGGPTREMLAAAARTASLEGSPTVRLASPRQFFDDAFAEYPDAPVWAGELYLEFHRGTYTSQARTKQGNRRCEHLLREAELWSATAAVRSGFDYPYETLESAWQTVLLQQFHDILPGSSIAWVHREAERNYAEVAETLETVIADAQAALAADAHAALTDGGDDVRGDVPAARATATRFNAAPIVIDGVPPLAAGVPVGTGRVSVRREGDRIVLESDAARFVLDATGRISSAIDAVSGREAVAPGEAAATLQLFRDTPRQWDAWDIDVEYRRHGADLTEADAIEVVEDGEDRVSVRVDRSVGSSSIRQFFSLSRGSGTLEITTEVDWHERQKLLKLAFPLDVHAERAASEVQFGHVYRPTHENTSWDAARFETCAHRWVHVGEPGYGIAIANDSTYGHDVTSTQRTGGGVTTLVRQSLLRAPLFPDPEADQGGHVLRSSFTPGARVADAIAAGYRINLPLREGSAAVAPLVRIDDPGVLVETVKLAEDRSPDVVVRLYESLGRRTSARLECADAVESIVETDLLERPLADPRAVRPDVEGSVRLELGPFQVVTLRLRRA
jgi:alpha-mannosidase